MPRRTLFCSSQARHEVIAAKVEAFKERLMPADDNVPPMTKCLRLGVRLMGRFLLR